MTLFQIIICIFLGILGMGIFFFLVDEIIPDIIKDIKSWYNKIKL